MVARRPMLLVPPRHLMLLHGLIPRNAMGEGELDGGGGGITPGAQNFLNPGGPFNLLVPIYAVFNLDLRGGGGGGGAGYESGGPRAANGGNTSFNGPIGVIALGGIGGVSADQETTGAAGAPGAGSNGTITVGGGALGGIGGYTPGGAGWTVGTGGQGGNGGRLVRIFRLGDPGAPIPHTTYQVFVGGGGAGRAGAGTHGAGSNGGAGAGYFSWS